MVDAVVAKSKTGSMVPAVAPGVRVATPVGPMAAWDASVAAVAAEAMRTPPTVVAAGLLPRFSSSALTKWSQAAEAAEAQRMRAQGARVARPVVWTDPIRAATEAAGSLWAREV